MLKAVIIVSTILMGAGVCPGLAQEAAKPAGPTALGRLTPVEQYVLDSVAAGGVADLKEKFGEEEGARTLRAGLVEALLTGGIAGVKVQRSGFYLVNAVISGILALEFASVEPPVFFVGCRFKDLVNCGGSLFKKNLVIKQSIFEQTANFYRLQVGVDAFFGDTTFQGPADFGGANIEGQFTLAGARFAGPTREANFNGLTVGQSLVIKEGDFRRRRRFQRG